MLPHRLILDAFHFINRGNAMHLVLVTGHNELIEENEIVKGCYILPNWTTYAFIKAICDIIIVLLITSDPLATSSA